MTIIIVNDYDYIQGGASKVAIETANLLYSNNYNVIFFCSVSNRERSNLNKQIKVYSLNQTDCLSQKSLKGLFQGIYNRQARKEFKKLLSSIDGDIIVHIHGWTKSLSSSFINAVKDHNRIKVVLTLHDFFSICPNGGLFNYKKNSVCHIKPLSTKCFLTNCDSRNYIIKLYRFVREFYQNKICKFRSRIDLVITISSLQKKVLSPFFPGKELIYVYNPTSIEKQPENRIYSEINNEYLYVGRLTEDKGIDILCEYFSHRKETLNVVGKGYLSDKLIKKYFDFKNIKFHGWLSPEKTFTMMGNARALFVPSVYYEGAPLTVFEGLAQGLPVIVSEICSGADFIDENCGIIFDPYNADEFDKIMNSLDDEIIRGISIHSFNNYWNNPYDKNRYFLNLSRVYEDLLIEK